MDSASILVNNTDVSAHIDVRVVTMSVQDCSLPNPGGHCGLHKEVGMPDLVVLLMRRARNCPVACSLKILFFLLLLAALYLAIYQQTSMTLPWYMLFLGAIAVEAALMLFANNNCRIRISESPE